MRAKILTYCLVLPGTATLFLVYRLFRARTRRAASAGSTKTLPGPWLPTPVRLNELSEAQLNAFMAQYGPIFSFHFLSVNFLFLCDADSIRDALINQGDVFAGRLSLSAYRFIDKGCGIAFVDGPKWQEHRRFILSALRNFGFGKTIAEDIVREEMQMLCDDLKQTRSISAGNGLFPRSLLLKSIANVICLLVFGERCATKQDFDLLMRVTTDTLRSDTFNSVVVLLFYRLVLLMPGDYFGLKKFLKDLNEMQTYMFEKIKWHKETIDWNNERDLIDAYLIEARKRDQESVNGHTFTDFQLFRVVMELFAAGTETTTTTLTWALLLMAKHPDVQNRVQREIDSVIGEKLPRFSDRNKLVYTSAVIHEIERFVTIVPFSIPRRVTQDTELRGYYVPANTIVTPYLLGVHRDSRLWKNPKLFDPSHFFDESTQSLRNVNNLMSFGVGKRSCLGESLAMQELFVFFTGLLQQFRIEVDPKHPLPSLENEKIGALRFVPEFKVLILPRQSC